jgi:hypothetical protein
MLTATLFPEKNDGCTDDNNVDDCAFVPDEWVLYLATYSNRLPRVALDKEARTAFTKTQDVTSIRFEVLWVVLEERQSLSKF